MTMLTLLRKKRRQNIRYLGQARFNAVQDPLSSMEGWTITNTRSSLATDGTALLTGGSSTYGEVVDFAYGVQGMVGPLLSRSAGRCLQVLVTPEDRNSWFVFGWTDQSSSGSHANKGHVLVHEDGKLVVGNLSKKITLDPRDRTLRPMQYLVTIILQAKGAWYFLSTFSQDDGGGMVDPLGIPKFPDARLIWVDQFDTTANLRPTIQFRKELSYPEGHIFQHVRWFDITDPVWKTDGGIASAFDRVARANHASSPGGTFVSRSGTWGVTSNAIKLQSTGGTNYTIMDAPSDGLFIVKIVKPASLPFFGVPFRETAPGDFLLWYNNGGNEMRLRRYVANASVGEAFNYSPTWTLNGSDTFAFIAIGNKYIAWTNDVAAFSGGWTTDPNSWNLTGRGIGAFALDNGSQASFSDFAVYPLILTLPKECRKGAVPNTTTFSSTVEIDSFTASNGTLLSASGWTMHGSTVGTITSNKVALSGADQMIAHKPYHSGQMECSIDVTCPTGTITFIFAGIALYLDANNWIAFRCAIDKVGQPDADEIEVLECIAGQERVVRKVQMDGTFYVSGSTNTLTVRRVQDRWGDWAQILLGGRARESHRIPAALRNASKWGLYRSTFDNGCTFDNWLVKQ